MREETIMTKERELAHSKMADLIILSDRQNIDIERAGFDFMWLMIAGHVKGLK